MRKLKLCRNDSQGDLSDYAYSTSSFIKILKQIANPFHGCTTCTQYHARPKIQKVQRINSYPDSVETSCVQSQNQRYSENMDNQYEMLKFNLASCGTDETTIFGIFAVVKGK